jgi:environmental stress-induced protein Ves
MGNMLQMARIDHHAYAPGTWAGGATRGIWADPAAAIGAPAAARCWAGTATIEHSAPYSHFAGRHRLQILIGGAALRLRFRKPDEEVALVRGAQHQFSGERPVEATPLHGSVVAFNLIYRADVLAAATVATLGESELLWPPGAGAELGVQRERIPIQLIYVVAGAVEVGAAGTAAAAALQTDDTLVVAPPLHGETAPTLALKAMRPEGSEVILATFWLPTNDDPEAG